ncbi:MAG: class I SAM-dependent RNA methyltransferase [Spirochaetaceae bacterium]|jgi:23S rRNA (uracil1939-C5)-methyltransferase|nr:class I SAM-dependent RNA methyltransferase [Spirochaetaceae bacterium]
MDYAEQLGKKKAFLSEAFLRAGVPTLADIPEIKVIPSRPFEYRNRIQLRRVPRGTENDVPRGKSRLRPLRPERAQPAAYGFMTRSGGKDGGKNGSRAVEIVPVNDCLTADPLIRHALKNGRLIPPIDRDRFSVYGKDSTLLIEGRNSRGMARMREKIIAMDAGVFFQSNGALLELLIGDILSVSKDADKKLAAADFYSGVGTFATFLQDDFQRIDLLESNKAALALYRENVKLKDARFFGQNDTVWARNSGKYIKKPYGFVIADPGRQGMGEAMLRFLGSNCEILCYVSCNPASLARDAAVLLNPAGNTGLKLVSLSFYDFYPQTKHIESLSVFIRPAP